MASLLDLAKKLRDNFDQDKTMPGFQLARGGLTNQINNVRNTVSAVGKVAPKIAEIGIRQGMQSQPAHIRAFEPVLQTSVRSGFKGLPLLFNSLTNPAGYLGYTSSNPTPEGAETTGLPQMGRGLLNNISTIPDSFSSNPIKQRSARIQQTKGAKDIMQGGLKLALTAGSALFPGAGNAIGVGSILGGGFSGMSGKSPLAGAQVGGIQGLQSNTVVQATNPLLNKVLPQGSGIIKDRLIPAAANVIQGRAVDAALGQDPLDPLSVSIDIATGLMGKRGQFSPQEKQEMVTFARNFLSKKAPGKIKLGPALYEGGKPSVKFVEPQVRGDITALEKALDEALGTDSYRTTTSWKGTLPARKTAMDALEYEASLGTPGAEKYLDYVMQLEDQIAELQMRGQQTRQAKDAAEGVIGKGKGYKIMATPQVRPEVSPIAAQPKPEIPTQTRPISLDEFLGTKPQQETIPDQQVGKINYIQTKYGLVPVKSNGIRTPMDIERVNDFVAPKNTQVNQNLSLPNPQRLLLDAGNRTVSSGQQARQIRARYPQTNITVDNPLKPNNRPISPIIYDAPQLSAGTREVNTGRQARAALKIPGLNIQVNNPLKPGTEPLVPRPNVDAMPRTTMADVETKLFGSATPEQTQLGGNKQGAGIISNALRNLEAWGSNKLGNYRYSDSSTTRAIANLARGFVGGLGKTQGDIRLASQTKGKMSYGTMLGNEVQSQVYSLVNNDSESLKRIHSVLDPELSKLTVSEADLKPNEKEALGLLRTMSDFINDTNYANGFISEQTWLNGRGGKYLARAYETFDYPPEVADYIKQNKVKFDLGQYKQRTEVNDWKQENAITDPAYLVSKRLHQTVFNDAVSKMMNNLVGTAKVSDTPQPGFVQLADHKGYGQLAGKWVAKDVMEDVKGMYFTTENIQKAYDVLNWFNRLPLRQAQKKLLTVFNPSVGLGNITNNQVFGWLSGINPASFAKNEAWAVGEIRSKGQLYRRAYQDGLLGTDVFRGDLVNMAEQLKKGVTDKNVLQKIDEVGSGIYSGADDAAKMAALKTFLDRGYTYEEAARRVTESFQNYHMVGWLYDIGAKVPILGNPFVKFAPDWLRIMKNGFRDHPLRFAGTIAAWKLFTDVMSAASGETAQDRETRENRIGNSRIPFTNISLEVQTPMGAIDAGRLFTNPAYVQPDDSALASTEKYLPFMRPKFNESTGKLYNVSGDPLIGPAINLALDSDFRGKSIKDPMQSKYTGAILPQDEQRMRQAQYLARSYGGGLVSSLDDLRASLQGEKTFYGSERTPTQAALRVFPGVKVEQYGPTQAAEARSRDMEFTAGRVNNINKDISAITNKMQAGKIDQETAQKRILELQAERQGLYQKTANTGTVQASAGNPTGSTTGGITTADSGASTLDKETARFQLAASGQKAMVDGSTVFYMKNDQMNQVDLSPMKDLETTDNTELDREIIKDYKSEISKRKNAIKDLWEMGEIDTDTAEKLLASLEVQYDNASAKGKKPKKVKIGKAAKSKAFKLPAAAKAKKIKIAGSTSAIKLPKAKTPTTTKAPSIRISGGTFTPKKVSSQGISVRF